MMGKQRSIRKHYWQVEEKPGRAPFPVQSDVRYAPKADIDGLLSVDSVFDRNLSHSKHLVKLIFGWFADARLERYFGCPC